MHMLLCYALALVLAAASVYSQATVTVTDAAAFSSALMNGGTTRIVVASNVVLDGSNGGLTIGPRSAPLTIAADASDISLVGNGWRMFTINDEGVCTRMRPCNVPAEHPPAFCLT